MKKLTEYLLFLIFPRKNKRLAFNLIYKISSFLLPQYKLYWANLDWLSNRKFFDFLQNYDETNSLNTHRRWALSELLRLTTDIEGDTAECGVYKGCASHTILLSNQLSKHSKHHYIFDSFEGLSLPSDQDNSYWHKGDLSIGEQIVAKNLRDFDAKTLIKGWIPTGFDQVKNRKFSFVHINVDLYEPTLESIRFFYPLLSTGAILICDDYGFESCVGATKAIDEFLSDKDEKMIKFPQGGGFFIKGTMTAKGVFDE